MTADTDVEKYVSRLIKESQGKIAYRRAFALRYKKYSGRAFVAAILTYVLLWVLQAPPSARYLLWNLSGQYQLSALNYVIGFHFFNLAWPLMYYLVATSNYVLAFVDPRVLWYSACSAWCAFVTLHLYVELYRINLSFTEIDFSLQSQLLSDMFLQIYAAVGSVILLLFYFCLSAISTKIGQA